VRVVVLGGSGSSTPELFDALANWPGGTDRRPQLEIVLVGRSAAKLATVEVACRARTGQGPPLEVTGETDRRRALAGADVVLNQVRIGGYAARAFDESFPWPMGIPGEETMGPGGFANAVRTVPALRATWRDITDLAPTALVINLTNPAGIVQAAALEEYPDLRIVSVCDSPMPVLDQIGERLGRDRQRVWPRYLGMNHLGWWVPEPADGPEVLEAAADLAVGNDPLDVRLQEAVPMPYVRYYLHADRILVQQQGRKTRAQLLMDLESTLLAGYREDPAADLPRRGAYVWYRMAVVAFLDAWVNGTSEALILAGVRNGGRVPSLPPDVVIELPHRTHGPGDIRPLAPVDLPPLPLHLLQAHATYESLAVKSLAPGADDGAKLRALVANPMVRDVDRAVALWQAMRSAPSG
jgi:6-phospho-beta-glucosidase